MMRLARVVLTFVIAAATALPAAAQTLPTISTSARSPRGRVAPPRPGPPFVAAAVPGQQCTTLTFEGLADQVAVPSVSGINSPGWLSLIDEDAGGTGNFANEPSPETVMFWLGSNPSIVLDVPASKIEFSYSTSVFLRVRAFDASNALIAQIDRAPNYLGGPGDPKGVYSGWSPLTVEVPGKRIKRLDVIGGPNYTGFDNLTVCHAVAVGSVEVTQAIQQLQPVADLKTKLLVDREPPVPLVAGKPAVLRVYLEQVAAVARAVVEVTGSITAARAVTLQPQCTIDLQRLNQNGCASVDIYFQPAAGNFDVTVKVRDTSGTVVDTHDLPLSARTTNALKLKAVSICDDQDLAGTWLCASVSGLAANIGVLKKIAPSSSVTVETTATMVNEAISGHAQVATWWPAAIGKVANLYGLFDWANAAIGTTVKYYGMIRTSLPGGMGGMADAIPGNGAGSRTAVVRLGVDTMAETVAHEVGHTLGLKHTNNDVPQAASTPPGCYNLAADSSTDWPFANNYIQSTARLEVGFDVAARRALDPQNTFDIMSYCVPRWISPLRYKRLITSLSGGPVTSPTVPVPAAVGPAWLVSGTITSGAAQLNPLFVVDATSNPGAGTHVVEAVDGGGGVLASSRFTPGSATDESSGSETPGPPAFTTVLTKPAGAVALVVRSDTNAVLATVPLTGTAPTVQLVTPATATVLTGPALVTWNIIDPDSATHHTRVHYSGDNGVTWADLGLVTTTSLPVNFDLVPGGASARLRLMVSDGVNSTSTVFGPFSAPRKNAVTAAILSSFAGGVVAPGTLYLDGVGTDVDDGALTGTSLSWSSSRDGALGTGDRIAVDLSTGSHTIQLTATDSDGNSSTAALNLLVAGSAPTIDVTTRIVDTLPTTCVVATLAVTTPGLPAARIEYSLNGGLSWTPVAGNQTPYSFIVPGSGYVNFVARVTDAAGQSDADGEQFFTSAACAQPAVITPGSWNAPAAASTQPIMLTAGNSSLAWTASTDRPWLTVTPSSGTGSAVVTIRAAATSSVTSRTGSVTIAGQTVLVTQAGGPQGPYDFRVVDVVGNQVTLQWAYDGTTAGFTLAGGLAVGETLAVVPLGTAVPRVTLTAPSGIYFLRVHTVEDTALAQPSNEVPVVVNVPAAPSAPTALLATTSGGQLDLVWTNTFAGGAPTGVTLQVTGDLAGAAPLGLTDRFSFNGVPPGTYQMSVVATNAAGTSAPSAPVTVTFPGTCTPPETPRRFLAYAVGNVVVVVWDHAATGSAPTGYDLSVAELAVTVPVGPVRSVSAPVGPGNYTLSVRASNACGASAPTVAQTVVVP